MSSLFRPEVVAFKKQAWLGPIILIRPISLTVLTSLVVATAACTGAYLFVGEYTKKARILGFLAPDRGIIRLIPQQAGTLLERLASEGEFVRKDAPLFVISLERSTLSGATQASVEQSLRARARSLDEARRQQRLLADQQAAALSRRSDELRMELAQLVREIELHERRCALAERSVARQRDLRASNFISDAQVQQKEEELIDLKARLEAARRSRLAVERDLRSVEDELRALPARNKVQEGEIDRSLALIAQESAENEAREKIVMRAPQDGVVTGLIAQPGQTVTPASAIASLVPADAHLQAQLYAPSHAAGFVQAGQTVLLRYQPFPYQKFGHASGRVVSVSQSALNPADLAGLPVVGADVANEPLYRITVALESETINAYGRQQRLQPGTQLDADVLLDRRRLIEWIFEPMLSLTGKL